MRVSVILPVYNEADCIARTVDQVLSFAAEHPEYQFIFVNDGSSDRTLDILECRVGGDAANSIQIVSYPVNRGKGYAVKAGIKWSRGDYICFLDSDLAYTLSHLEKLVAELENCDVAIGNRLLAPAFSGRVRLRRRMIGRTFNLISRTVLGLPYRDMQAGIKGFRRRAAVHLFEQQTIGRFCFDVELIYLAQKYGYRISEIPAIVSDCHFEKKSKVNLFIDPARMLINLLRIKLNDNRSRYEPIPLPRVFLPYR